MLKSLFFLTLFIPTICLAQFTNDFEDADISDWTESDPGHWAASDISPITGTFSLHHIFDNPDAGRDQVSIELPVLDFNDTVTWEFRVLHGYSPSSSNNWSVFLISDANSGEMNPSGSANGYAVGVNYTGSTDTLKFWKITSGSATEIFKTTVNWQLDVGTSKAPAIQVIRTPAGLWKINFNGDGDFNNLTEVGSGTDVTYTFTGYFGIYFEYSSSQDQQLWVDDINIVGEIFVDNIPPLLDSLSIISSNEIYLEFNEHIDSVTVVNFLNYSIDGGIDNPDSIYYNDAGNAVNIFFPDNLSNKQYYHIFIRNIEDVAGNSINDTTIRFLYFVPGPFDIVVNEIMADPTPEVDLPGYEYVEILNTTEFDIDLTGWKLKIGSSERVFPDQVLDSAAYVTLCSVTAAEFLDDYGSVIDFSSFPTITNSGTSILILDENNVIIDSVNFTTDWYHNTDKEDGGWSIERIDPLNTCSEITNWKASEDANGGTPGQENSVFGSNIDTQAPIIVGIEIVSDNELRLYFNEPLESTGAETTLNYSISNGIGNPATAIMNSNKTEVSLSFSNSFEDEQEYILSTENLTDFCGNVISGQDSEFVYYVVKPFDVVVNEIFADPDPVIGLPEFEFIEIYNTSGFDLNLSGWKLKVGTTLRNFPDYTLDSAAYVTLCPAGAISFYNLYGNALGFTSFPAISNAGTSILILDENNVIIDSINFTTNWYHDNQKDNGGWSLEKIDPLNNCSGITNWKASESSDGGTPCRENSVFTSNIDNEAPYVVKVEIISGNQLRVYLNEPLTYQSILEKTNYEIDNGVGNPFSVNTSEDLREADLLFLKFFPEKVDLTLITRNLTDNCGNSGNTDGYLLLYFFVQPYDIVFNEIMADPEPTVGLPEYEYLEIYNRSNFSINLNKWTLQVGSTVKTLPEKFINSHDYLILTSIEANSVLGEFGDVLSISGFPGLANNGQMLILKDPTGQIISQVIYSVDWYQDNYKAEGGWSLEQIDHTNPCGGENNWIASESQQGGTPGYENSVFTSNPDLDAPELLRISVVDNKNIQLYFNESIDSITAFQPGNYMVDNGIDSPVSIQFSGIGYKSLILGFTTEFETSRTYELQIPGGIFDCSGNEIYDKNIAKFAVPLIPEENDLVFNEVLFNPLPNGNDFVEIYNRSEKTLDLQDLLVASYDDEDMEYSDIEKISPEGYLIFPGEYMVLTENPATVQRDYFTTNPMGFIKVNNLPAFNDDKGRIMLLDKQQNIIDNFAYNEDLHFALLATYEGVSLERINYENPANDKTNWHSASELVGFATPGYENSQYKELEKTNEEVRVEPEVFSPDNDGYEDFTNISFVLEEPGYVVNIKIYDSKGRLVKYLANNMLLSVESVITWDGVDDNNQKAAIGIYVIFVEIFDLDGNIKRYKKSVVVAAKY